MSVKTIAVIIAMEAEAAPLVEHLGLKKAEPSPFPGPLPAVVYSGAVGGATVHVCTNGPARGFGVDSVGTVPAALTAYHICQTLKPDLLVNAGTAGGFKAKGGAIGDVYLATAFKNHDRRIPIPVSTPTASAPPTPPRLQPSRRHGLQGWRRLHQYPRRPRRRPRRHQGRTTRPSRRWKPPTSAPITTMFDIPFIAVKAITDIVDGDKPTQDEFLENLGAAAKALQGAVPRVLEFVAGKEVAQL